MSTCQRRLHCLQASVNVSTSPPSPGFTLSYIIIESGGGSATFQAGSTSTTTDSSVRPQYPKLPVLWQLAQGCLCQSAHFTLDRRARG